MLNVLFRVLTPNETVVWIPRKGPISEHSACLGESLREARSGCGSPWGHRHWWQPFPGAAPTTCTLVWADTTKEFSHLDIPDSHHQLKRNKTIEKIFIINHEANRIKTFLISRNKVKHCPLNPFLSDINLYHMYILSTNQWRIEFLFFHKHSSQLWNHKGSLEELNLIPQHPLFRILWESESLRQTFFFGHTLWHAES